MEKDDTDGGSDKNGGLTTHHGMNDRKDVTSTSSGTLQIDSGFIGGLQIRMGLYKRHVRRNCLHPA